MGTLGMVARPWSSSCLSCGERLFLGCDGNTGNFFPYHAGTGSLLSSSSSSVTLPFAWIKGSVSFSRGFHTRLSHDAFPQGCPTCQRCVSRFLALKSRQCRENRFPWNGLRHLGDSGNVARPLSSSRLSCGERLLLRCDRNARNSFSTTQGKDPSSRARGRKRGSSLCWRDSRASS